MLPLSMTYKETGRQAAYRQQPMNSKPCRGIQGPAHGRGSTGAGPERDMATQKTVSVGVGVTMGL